MTKGARSPAEWRTFTDRETGVVVRQLTSYKGHSHHLYFTNLGWYAGGRKLLFGSDRGNRTNLFGLDLDDGAITQLTDLDQPPPPTETSLLFASKNPRFSPDGRQSLFASDAAGYGNLHLVDVPDFEALPAAI